MTPELRAKLVGRGVAPKELEAIEETADRANFAKMEIDLKEGKSMLAKNDAELKTLRANKTPNDAVTKRIATLERESKEITEMVDFDEARMHGAKTRVLSHEARAEAEKVKLYDAADQHNLEPHAKKLREIQDEATKAEAILERELTKRGEKIALIRKSVGAGSAAEKAVESEMNQLLMDFKFSQKTVAVGIVQQAGLIQKVKSAITSRLGVKAAENACYADIQDLAKSIRRAKSGQFRDAKRFGGITQAIAKHHYGKFAFYGLALTAGTALQHDEENGVDWGTAAKQTAFDVAPITGEFSDFYAAITGKEYFTNRKLDMSDRTLRAVFGIGGTLVTAAQAAELFFTAGAAAPVVGLEAGAWATFKASKLGLKTAKALGKVKNAEQIANSAKGIGKVGSRLRLAGMGGALGMLGYNLIATPEEIDIPHESQAIIAQASELAEQPEPTKG
jgi:hypothetical protein